jgi:hypothetical protein
MIPGPGGDTAIFIWAKENYAEIMACGISDENARLALRYFKRAMQEMMLGGHFSRPNDVDSFFSSIYDNAIVMYQTESGADIARGDRTLANAHNDVLHALHHYAVYAAAQARYDQCAVAFNAAVKELIGE